MAVQLLINGLEFGLKMVWKTWKSQGISFSDFAGHPEILEGEYLVNVNRAR